MDALTLKKDFIKTIDSMDRSKSRGEHFRNFCEMTYCAYAKTTAQNKERADKLEDQYMSIVGTYKNKDDVRLMPKLVSITMLALHEKGCDFLGEIAAELGTLDKKNGQFFTPYDVSKLMAHIILPDIESLIKEDGFFTLNDPAAGAGCMVLCAADIVQEKGFEPMDCMSVQVTELNKSTYHMLFVQLTLRGIAAEVIHGNSLSLETFESAYTPAAIPFFGKHGRMFKEVLKAETPVRADFEVMPILNADQLDLFK